MNKRPKCLDLQAQSLWTDTRVEFLCLGSIPKKNISVQALNHLIYMLIRPSQIPLYLFTRHLSLEILRPDLNPRSEWLVYFPGSLFREWLVNTQSCVPEYIIPSTNKMIISKTCTLEHQNDRCQILPTAVIFVKSPFFTLMLKLNI
jgi:hypothetical protein